VSDLPPETPPHPTGTSTGGRPVRRDQLLPVLHEPRRGAARARSHYRFRKSGTDYFCESSMKWMSGGAKRQCDRALGAAPGRLRQRHGDPLPRRRLGVRPAGWRRERARAALPFRSAINCAAAESGFFILVWLKDGVRLHAVRLWRLYDPRAGTSPGYASGAGNLQLSASNKTWPRGGWASPGR
jgi:hypothetical protein